MYRALVAAILLGATPTWAAPAVEPLWQALSETPDLRSLQITQNYCSGSMHTWMLMRSDEQTVACKLGETSQCEATTLAKLDQRTLCTRSIEHPLDPGWAAPVVRVLSASRPFITSARTLTPKHGPAVLFVSQPTERHLGAWWMAVRTEAGWRGGTQPVEAQAQSLFSDDKVVVNPAGTEPAWAVQYTTARIASGGGIYHRRLVFVQSDGQQWPTQRTVGVYTYEWDVFAKQQLHEQGLLRDLHARAHVDVQLTPTFTADGKLQLDLELHSQRDMEDREAKALLGDVGTHRLVDGTLRPPQ